MALSQVPDGPLRSGYTTGACATACAKAALISLITQQPAKEVEIILPLGEKVLFKIKENVFNSISATCTTIKDAGDDPDVTHGAEIGCTITLTDSPEIQFVKGEGVGLITLPGLSIPIGEPAINPVPRQMIKNALNFVLHQYQLNKGAKAEVFVINGKEIAKKTLNARLGILGGISILGTTGIVRPFSAAAYIASITQGIDVAVANGANEIIINSGGRTENKLKELFNHLPEFCFIQYGNWIGETLEKLNTVQIDKLTIGMMLGKAVKLAQGEFNTHSNTSSWDKNFILKIARESGYREEQYKQVLELNMARRLTEVFDFNENEPFYQKLLEYCFRQCTSKLKIIKPEIILFDAKDRPIKYGAK